jgi:hypothetical protein
MDFDIKIFENKSLSDIFHNIYNNTSDKERQIKALIGGLQPLVKDTQSALMIVPLIKEYLDVSIKNDDALIKMASIVQRAMANNKNGGDDFSLSDQELEQLTNIAKDINQNTNTEEVKPKKNVKLKK